MWPVFLIGFSIGLHNLLAGFERRQFGKVFAQRFPGHRHAIAVEQTFFEQILHHPRRAADVVQIFLHVLAAGLQIGDVRHAAADLLKIVDRQFDFGRAGHRNQMQHGVGRAAQRHHDRPSRFRRRGAS